MKKLRHVSSERNLRTERLIFCRSLTYRDGDLPPDQQTSTKNVSPSPRQWTSCLDSAWTCPSLHSLPINRLLPKPSNNSGYSMHFPNCNSSATLKSKISGNLRLPQFTSLFRLTLNGVRSGIQGRAPQEGQWLSSVSKVPVLSPCAQCFLESLLLAWWVCSWISSSLP